MGHLDRALLPRRKSGDGTPFFSGPAAIGPKRLWRIIRYQRIVVNKNISLTDIRAQARTPNRTCALGMSDNFFAGVLELGREEVRRDEPGAGVEERVGAVAERVHGLPASLNAMVRRVLFVAALCERRSAVIDRSPQEPRRRS